MVKYTVSKQLVSSKRVAKRSIAKATEQYSDKLTLIDPIDYPNIPVRENLIEVWISKKYLVQIYAIQTGIIRISVNKTSLQGVGFRKDGNMAWAEISWEELQDIKNTVGFEDHCAVEVFPPAELVVNVANMRHLWVLADCPKFVWGAQS